MLYSTLLGRNRHIWMVAASPVHSYLNVFMGIIAGQYRLKPSLASEDLVG